MCIRILQATLIALALTCPLQSSTADELRQWSDASGKFAVEAKLVSQDEDSVTLLRKNGESVSVPKARLCATDLEYLANLAKLKPPKTMTERDRLHAELGDELALALAPIDSSAAKSRAKRSRIQKKIDRLKKVSQLSDRGRETMAKYRKEVATVDKETARFTSEAQKVRYSFDQRRLKVLVDHPLPGEQSPVRFEGKWMTVADHSDLLKDREAKKRAEENESRNRVTGERLANWAMAQMQSQYKMEIDAKTPFLLRESGVRFVSPTRAEVYSLAPKGTKVGRSFGASGRSDYSYPYLITWRTSGGLVLQKNGYVEVGFDVNGVAYLQGVQLPFLDNPLNGNLAATRSPLDSALQRAFGH